MSDALSALGDNAASVLAINQAIGELVSRFLTTQGGRGGA